MFLEVKERKVLVLARTAGHNVLCHRTMFQKTGFSYNFNGSKNDYYVIKLDLSTG